MRDEDLLGGIEGGFDCPYQARAPLLIKSRSMPIALTTGYFFFGMYRSVIVPS